MRFKNIQVLTRKARNIIPYPIAVGQVTEVVDEVTKKVKVLDMKLNEYLKMYFNKSYEFQAEDNKGCIKGDIVLVTRLAQLKTQRTRFNIEKVIFKIDNIIDPITKKSVNHDTEIIKKHLESIQNSMKNQASN